MRGASLKRVLAGLVYGLVGLYLGLTLLAYFGQRWLMYPAPRGLREPVARGAELLRLGGGVRPVYALFAPPPAEAPTLVYFHGNGETLADIAGLVEEFAARRVGVLAIEYPGYGVARAAATTEEHMYADAERALAHLHRELGIPAGRIVLVGHSLGTGVAAEMALRGHAARMVLLAPYTSMLDMAKTVTWILPVRLLLRDRYDTLAKAPRLDLPVLIVHGTEDHVVPTRMGQELAARLPRAKLELVRGAGHNDLFDFPGRDLVGEIVAFAVGTPSRRL